MKGHSGAGKRGKRWPQVLHYIVAFSLLFPSLYVFFPQNRPHYGYTAGEGRIPESAFVSYGYRGNGGSLDLVKGDHPKIQSAFTTFRSSLSKNTTESIMNQNKDDVGTKTHMVSIDSGKQLNSQQDNIPQTRLKGVSPQSDLKDNCSCNTQSTGSLTPHIAASNLLLAPNITNVDETRRHGLVKNFSGDENRKSCQLEFGSYCLWSLEHKELMRDTVVRELKDQLFVARAYHPSITKLPGEGNLAVELRQNIQEHERMLSEAIVDADLPPFAGNNVMKMNQVIRKAKSCAVDCHNVEKKLIQILDLAEDEAHFLMRQNVFLYQLGIQTMPKSYHCLSMRLTVEYFKSPPSDLEEAHAHKIESPWLRHVVIFSKNILAAAVAINSTVVNAEDTASLVFHLLTDVQNYYAMRLWFARNSYKEATIHVLNFDEILINHSQGDDTLLSPSEEFRVSIRNNDQTHHEQFRTEYLSVFGSSHFLLPQIFTNLKKVVVLDDDVVVQQDLSFLWNLDLQGKVSGAMEFCGVRLDQLKSYLGATEYIGNPCAWMSGLNIVDLDMWRQRDVSGTYRHVLQKVQKKDEVSRRTAALPATILAFQDLVYPLDSSWVQSGLGHHHSITADTIRNVSVLHYNGNMKPWLELGIPSYKDLWRKYLTKEEQFIHECNLSV